MPDDKKLTVHEAVLEVMKTVENVGKDGYNTSQKFSFRGIDDMVAALQPAMLAVGLTVFPQVAEHHVTISPDGRVTKATVLVDFVMTGPDGTQIAARMSGEANDHGDKATNKAISAAAKYFLFYTFWMPVAREDADSFTVPGSVGAPPRVATQAPQSTRERVASAAGSGDKLSDGQSRNIYRLYHHKLGWDKDSFLDNAAGIIGHTISSDGDLTKREAGKVIEALKKLAGEDDGDPGPTPPPAYGTDEEDF